MTKYFTIALDIGATKINAGLVSPGGRIVARERRNTDAKKPIPIILRNIFLVIDALAVQAKTKRMRAGAIGIGIAGEVDYKKGIYISGPNFNKNFKNIPLKNILKKKYRLPVIIDNDAHCFALGETFFGAGRPYKNIIGLTLGTGIGGGIIIDKKLYRGNNNTAGEFGHMVIDPMGPRCGCGRFGHLEAMSAGPAIKKLYLSLSGKNLGLQEIESKLKQGDKAGRIALAEASKKLALGLSNVMAILNPEIIIIGGGLARFKKYFDLTIKQAKKFIPFPLLLKTKIVRSRLDDDAQLLGAALLAGKVSK